MIITAALALAGGLAANGLFRVICRGLKYLLTVSTVVIFHRAIPQETKNSFSGTAVTVWDALSPHRG